MRIYFNPSLVFWRPGFDRYQYYLDICIIHLFINEFIYLSFYVSQREK